MSKNLKLSFIFTFVLFAVCLAWTSLANFFSGVGVNFVIMLALCLALLVIVLVDKQTKSRIMDLFIVCVVFLVLESVVYFALEFGSSSYSYLTLEAGVGQSNIFTAMHIYQNVISVLAFLFLAYAVFRLIYEIKGYRFAFVEVLLGNQKVQKKERQAKELSNGSLEEKPNKTEAEILDEDNQEVEEVFVDVNPNDKTEQGEE